MSRKKSAVQRKRKRKQQRREEGATTAVTSETTSVPLDKLPEHETTRPLRQAAVLQLQKGYGNNKVEQMLSGQQAGDLNVQRQSAESERLSNVKITPYESPRIRGRNSTKGLDTVSLSGLIKLYMTKNDSYVAENGILYTKKWIDEKGKSAIEGAIMTKLEIMRLEGRQEDLDLYLTISKSIAGDESAKQWLQSTIELTQKKRAFSPEKVKAFEEMYKLEVGPLSTYGGCMMAMYKGIEALYSADISEEIKKKSSQPP